MGSDLTALLSSLVAVDSVNPSLVPGGAGEGEIATVIHLKVESGPPKVPPRDPPGRR